MKFDFLSESDQAYFIHKASTLVEALPYIRQHSGKNIVIKYGGHAMGDKKIAESFSKDIGLLKEVGINPIVVHGGGPQIGAMLKKKNINSNFIEGLRVTDKETVKVVEEVLSKDINSEIVDSISASGGKAIGISGNDGLISATKLNVELKDSDSNIEKIVDAEVPWIMLMYESSYILHSKYLQNFRRSFFIRNYLKYLKKKL